MPPVQRLTYHITTMSAQIFELEEKDPNAPPPAEGEEEGEGPKGIIIQVPELALLRHRIDCINATTGVVPVVSG